MNNVEEALQDRKWLSPGVARRLLDINEATLRSWADSGLIRTFRTPGGHRRLSHDDILALIENSQQRPQAPTQATDTAVLPRIRRKLAAGQDHALQWHGNFEPAGQERMRLLGRELLTLCTESLGHPRQSEVLVSARAMGERYFREWAAQGRSLPDAIQAFVFFRGALLEAIRPVLLRRTSSSHEVSRCWQQLNRITDDVLLSMTQAFQQSHGAMEQVPA